MKSRPGAAHGAMRLAKQHEAPSLNQHQFIDRESFLRTSAFTTYAAGEDLPGHGYENNER